MPFTVFLALNTTRLGPGGQVIELAALAPERTDGGGISYRTSVHANEEVRPDAGALLQVPPRPAHLAVAPTLKDAAVGLKMWVPTGDIVWVGHRIREGLAILGAAGFELPFRCAEIACIDIHRLAHQLLAPEALAFGTTPQVLANVLGISIDSAPHPFRAWETTILLREIYRELRWHDRVALYDLQAVVELTERPIQYTRLPGAAPSVWLGQHYGAPFSEVPDEELVEIALHTKDRDLQRSIRGYLAARSEAVS